MPAKANDRDAGEALAVDWAQDRRQDRQPRRRLRPRAARLRLGAEQHDRIGAGEAARDGLAQRAGRDHPAVAEAVVGIDDDERQGLRRLPGSGTRHRAGSRAAPAATAARTPAARSRATQHGARAASSSASSPTCGRIVPGRIDPHRAGEAAAITARHDVRRDACAGEDAGERQHDRGLARAAGDQIADADHRHRRPIGPRQRAAQPSPRHPRPRRSAPAEPATSPGGSCPEIRGARASGAQPQRRSAPGRVAARSARARSSQGASRSSTASRMPQTGRGDARRRAARVGPQPPIGEQRRYRLREARRRRSRFRRRRRRQAPPPCAAQLLISGPCRIAQSSRAASNGLCPPLATSEPPIKAIPARR